MVLLLLSAFAVGLSGAMMPGSLLTYTIRKALSSGPRAGFVITAGHALLELVLIVLILLGFDLILQSRAAQVGIGLAGGALLAYMGFGMIAGAVKNRLSVGTGGESNGCGSLFLSGVLISAANPYFLLWWAVVGLGFLAQAHGSFGIAGAAVYYFGHIAADFGWYGLVSIVVGKTRRFIRETPYRVIIAGLGCLLVFFGAQFAYGAIISLIT